MKQNPDFIITDVAAEHILVPVGDSAVNFHSILSLNDMGQIVWNMLEKDMTGEELLKSILSEYDVTEQQARADLEEFLNKLRKAGAIIEEKA